MIWRSKINIEQLNDKEDKLVQTYQKSLLNAMKKSLLKKGANQSALSDYRKTMKKVAKRMVDSGLGLGLKWLNESLKDLDRR